MSILASYLDPVQLRRDLGMRDLSEPADGPHAFQILIGQAMEGLCRAWDCEIHWCSSPRIVPVADNYDRLPYPAEAITRDTRYTRYVDAREHAAQSFQRHDPPRQEGRSASDRLATAGDADGFDHKCTASVSGTASW